MDRAVSPSIHSLAVARLLLAVLLLATPAPAQMVTGSVIDAADSASISGATITFIDALTATERSVLSNSDGEFIIALMASGEYSIRVGRIGYTTIQTPPIEIGEREVVEVEVLLDVEAVALDPLTVVVRRKETQHERDLRGYYERVEKYGVADIGVNQIYTRETLQVWDALSVQDLFTYYIRWQPYGSCAPKVYLDGRSYLGNVGLLPVGTIEGIELYAGVGPGEGRFWDPDGCGVILVWRRVLPESGGGIKLVEVAAVIGVAVLLTVQALLLF